VWGSGGTAPRILTICTTWWWVVSFTPRPLYPKGKITRYQSDRRLGWPQSRSECCGEKSLPLSGSEPRSLGRPARSLITKHIEPIDSWFVSVFSEHSHIKERFITYLEDFVLQSLSHFNYRPRYRLVFDVSFYQTISSSECFSCLFLVHSSRYATSSPHPPTTHTAVWRYTRRRE
jgi:hypothetical protein